MFSVSVSTAEKQSSRMSTGALRIRPRPVSSLLLASRQRDSSSPTRVSSFSGKSSMVCFKSAEFAAAQISSRARFGYRKSGFPLKALQRETDLEAPLRLVMKLR